MGFIAFSYGSTFPASPQCGRHLLMAPRHGIDFTLVDPKAFFYHKLASVRAVVRPELTGKLALDYKETFGDKFIQEQITIIL